MIVDAWKTHAACRDADPKLFFPEGHRVPAEAVRLCASCPVKAECLEFALASGCDVAGIWAGTSERERDRIHARRRRVAS